MPAPASRLTQHEALAELHSGIFTVRKSVQWVDGQPIYSTAIPTPFGTERAKAIWAKRSKATNELHAAGMTPGETAFVNLVWLAMEGDASWMGAFLEILNGRSGLTPQAARIAAERSVIVERTEGRVDTTGTLTAWVSKHVGVAPLGLDHQRLVSAVTDMVTNLHADDKHAPEYGTDWCEWLERLDIRSLASDAVDEFMATQAAHREHWHVVGHVYGDA